MSVKSGVSVTSKAQHILRVFQNSVLRNVCGSKGTTENWEKIRNVEPHDTKFSQNNRDILALK